jgi:hypothetical protein
MAFLEKIVDMPRKKKQTVIQKRIYYLNYIIRIFRVHRNDAAVKREKIRKLELQKRWEEINKNAYLDTSTSSTAIIKINGATSIYGTYYITSISS